MAASNSYLARGDMLQRKLEPIIMAQARGDSRRKPQKSQLMNTLELVFVATHMVPPMALHILNIFTLGEYSLAGWFSAHQLFMTLLAILSPYMPLTRYQRYCLRIPCNVLATLSWWKVIGFSDFAVSLHAAIVAISVGLCCTLIWVAGAKLLASKALQCRGWNPYSRHEGSQAHLIVLGRLCNSSTFTPFWEEVYDRGFIYRAIANASSNWQNPSFDQVPLNYVSAAALTCAAVCFGAGHTRFEAEPVLGMLFALIMHATVFWFKSLGPAVLAHAVCNLTLGLWVIYSQDWMFW